MIQVLLYYDRVVWDVQHDCKKTTWNTPILSWLEVGSLITHPGFIGMEQHLQRTTDLYRWGIVKSGLESLLNGAHPDVVRSSKCGLHQRLLHNSYQMIPWYICSGKLLRVVFIRTHRRKMFCNVKTNISYWTSTGSHSLFHSISCQLNSKIEITSHGCNLKGQFTAHKAGLTPPCQVLLLISSPENLPCH